MRVVSFNDRIYEVDNENFLVDPNAWDENFAVGMALELGMTDGLTERHWKVIHWIRNRFEQTGTCPVVHETTQELGLKVRSLQQLFPTGYLRGACLLSGIGYKYGWVYFFEEPYVTVQRASEEKEQVRPEDRVYRVDLFGSLVDPSEWDEFFAARRAYEMNMKSGLTPRHWQIIRYLRESYDADGKIPTVYACCEANGIDMEDFAALFPTGYHRGAVKIAGLPTYGKGS